MLCLAHYVYIKTYLTTIFFLPIRVSNARARTLNFMTASCGGANPNERSTILYIGIYVYTKHSIIRQEGIMLSLVKSFGNIIKNQWFYVSAPFI